MMGALASALSFGDELRLLQRSKDQDSYSLHRLVGDVRRGEIPLEQRREWVETVCSRLGNWFQEKREDFSQLPRFESEIDHLKKWQEHAAHFAVSHSSRLMWLQGYPAFHRGRYVEAQNYVMAAERIFKHLGDTNRELWANLLNDQANINWGLGDLRSVLPNHVEALKIRKELFGERHPDIAKSLGNVGSLYGKQGDLQRALEYSEQALSMRRELFGKRHPDIADSLNGVGYWHGKQGDLLRALEYSQQALSMRRELFGERHPDIANSLNNVGGWYGEQGDVQRALEYSEQALAMLRELFGERHPDIRNSLNNVGGWYGEQGDVQRALEYSKKALAMSRDLFGERHPDIADYLSVVARWQSQQGDLRLALQYSKQSLAMYRELFGERHPTTIGEARRLAFNLIRLNRRKEAYYLVREFLGHAQGQFKEELKQLEARLLSTTPIPGRRQPSKSGKGKGKKKRR